MGNSKLLEWLHDLETYEQTPQYVESLIEIIRIQNRAMQIQIKMGSPSAKEAQEEIEFLIKDDNFEPY